MTYISSTYRPGIADRLRAATESFRAARAQRAVYRKTVHELSQLNERELADIGISRLSIEDVARRHAYGA